MTDARASSAVARVQKVLRRAAGVPQALLRPVASWRAQPHDRLPSLVAKVPGSGRPGPAGVRPGEVRWMHAGSAAAGAGRVTGGLGGQLGAAGHSELGEDVGQVGLHRRPADEQGGSDLRVRPTGGDVLGDLQLGRGKAGPSGRGPACAAHARAGRTRPPAQRRVSCLRRRRRRTPQRPGRAGCVSASARPPAGTGGTTEGRTAPVARRRRPAAARLRRGGLRRRRSGPASPRNRAGLGRVQPQRYDRLPGAVEITVAVGQDRRAHLFHRVLRPWPAAPPGGRRREAASVG